MIKDIRIEPIEKKEYYESIAYLPKHLVKDALDNAVLKLKETLPTFIDKFPSPVSENQVFNAIENVEWTTGFWTGELWLAYEYSKDSAFKEVANKHALDFRKRIVEKIEVEHHDMGFMYCPTCVASYQLDNNEQAKETALLAADNLLARFQEKGQFLQAWGELGAKDNYRLIIDCLMNLPLLYWASQITGNKEYHDKAITHYITSCNTVIRSDASAFHTFFFDHETGAPSHGAARQGFSDESAWARGQAWGIYGLALSYRYTRDPRALEVSRALANYFINRCPEDHVPYWDLIFTKEDGHVRDSSAAVIAVCGLLELDKLLEDSDPDKKVYQGYVSAVMQELITNYSTTKNCPESNGLLLHGIYNWNFQSGVDECTSWGDYFYMEALTRLYTDNEWNSYW